MPVVKLSAPNVPVSPVKMLIVVPRSDSLAVLATEASAVVLLVKPVVAGSVTALPTTALTHVFCNCSVAVPRAFVMSQTICWLSAVVATVQFGAAPPGVKATPARVQAMVDV